MDEDEYQLGMGEGDIGEREWTTRRSPTLGSYPTQSSLPGFDPGASLSTVTPSILRSYHISMLFSLADGFQEEAIDTAGPDHANNLRNMRDMDLGVFSDVTEFVGRGATFYVQRTLFPDGHDLVLKSQVFDHVVELQSGRRQVSTLEKLQAVLLELRVLTHPPLRHHPNIVQLVQVGWQGDPEDQGMKWPVLIQDYADKGTLADFFQSEKRVDFSVKMSLLRDVAEGLQALHQCKIVHGDLKLGNVLVFSNDSGGFTARVSDFGGALLDPSPTFQEPMGTPPWTAPEYGTDRPRDHLLLSDVYALGLLAWRIFLGGEDPFVQMTRQTAVSPTRDSVLSVIQSLKTSETFPAMVRNSLCDKLNELDLSGLDQFSANTICLCPTERDLRKALASLELASNREVEIIGSSSGLVGETDSDHEMLLDKDEGFEDDRSNVLQLSLAGLNFDGCTRALSGHVLRSFEYSSQYDADPDSQLSASSILARIYLTAQDVGIRPDIKKGLEFLVKSAERGSPEDQALVWRLYKAFGQSIPEDLDRYIPGWLMEAASMGSLTAQEDLRIQGLEYVLEKAMLQLQTRYCGVGYEIFEYEEKALEALSDPFLESGMAYLHLELDMGKSNDRDLRGYFTRLAATYDGSGAVNYLIDQLGANVNDENDVGDSPILCAARSGHKNTTLALLDKGASCNKATRKHETPLHWLSSFNDGDMGDVVSALLRHGADIDSVAEQWPSDGSLMYAETDYVPGTPLHRAVCRNNLSAVKALLARGANPLTPDLGDPVRTPTSLAVHLHYPEILQALLNAAGKFPPQDLISGPDGKSLLAVAIDGGSLHRATIGRLIRHGVAWKERAVETIKLLLSRSAGAHMDSLPDHPGCTALFYAARSHPHIIECLVENGAGSHLGQIGRRSLLSTEEDLLEDDKDEHPPLHEAILYGKMDNALKLIELGADASQVNNDSLPTTALYQCAINSVDDVDLVNSLCAAGLGVDDGPRGYETPFALAVRNGCYGLARLLRDRGADPNALFSRGYLFRSDTEHTLLFALLRNNRLPSLGSLRFLLDNPSTRMAAGGAGAGEGAGEGEGEGEGAGEGAGEGGTTTRVSPLIEPARNHTAFHVLAKLRGDGIDGDTASKALILCEEYFLAAGDQNDDGQDDNVGGDAGLRILNVRSTAYREPDGCETSVVARGGNTALHYAAIEANVEAVEFLLDRDADAKMTNAMGMTALDIASMSYPDFEKRFVPRDVPQGQERQLREGRERRERILKRLVEATPGGVNREILDKFEL